MKIIRRDALGRPIPIIEIVPPETFDRPTPVYPEALRKATTTPPDGGPSMLRIFHLLTRER